MSTTSPSSRPRREWAPPWAPLVKGWYTDRDEDGEQEVGATCTKCLGSFKAKCTSGLVRKKISAFAMSHTHRGPFDPIPKGP